MDPKTLEIKFTECFKKHHPNLTLSSECLSELVKQFTEKCPTFNEYENSFTCPQCGYDFVDKTKYLPPSSRYSNRN